MAGVITNKFGVDSVNEFISSVKNSDSGYYVYVARPEPWDNDSIPPTTNTALSTYEQDVYDDILYGKRISNNDIITMIPKYQWSNNTLYSAYDKDDPDLYSKQFFVFNNFNNSVYKVIDNNSSNSVVLPSVIDSGIFKTFDGYVWKYMFTIDSTNLSKFNSSNYIPVVPNNSIISSAIPGSIDAIKITYGGTGWVTFNTGIIQNVINANAIVIGQDASSNNNFYSGSSIYLKSGLGSGQLRKIASYNGSSKEIILQTPLDLYVNLKLKDNTGLFNIGDSVYQNTLTMAITWQSGYIQPGDIITQNISEATGIILTSNSSIIKVQQTSVDDFINDYGIDAGRGYTIGNSTVTTSSSSNILNATANALFTTFYPVGSYIKVGSFFHRVTAVANNTRLTVAEPFGATYATTAHYKVNSAATIPSYVSSNANGSIVFTDLNSVQLSIDTLIGNFDIGEIVTQSASVSNAVISFANTTSLILSSVSGTFATNNPIVGLTSNTSANVVIVSTNPTITVKTNYRNFILGAPIVSTSGGSGNVSTTTLIPNEQTEYVISPTINIVGDGINANGYCLVNTTSQSIKSIVMFNPGTNYTEANITITANSNYGQSVIVSPIISPLSGHGSNANEELGAKYAGISVEMGNTSNEQYNLLGYGSFRKVGLIKNPEFQDIYLTISDYDRASINVSSVTGAGYTLGEAVYQKNTGASATGIVVYSNSSFVEVRDLNGSFSNNAANVVLTGLNSEVTGNITKANTNYFNVLTNNQVIYQPNTGAYGILVSSNQTTLRIANTNGVFATNQVVYDASSNAYAIVTAIKTANNTKTFNFTYFNQTAKITLSSNTAAYIDNEKLSFKTPLDVIIGTGNVLNTTKEKQLAFTSATGSFLTNEKVTQGSANGIVRFANSTYLKLTDVLGQFTNTATITGQTSTVTATISGIYPVIVAYNINGLLATSNENYIYGEQSSAIGFSSFANSIVQPDLVRDQGTVLYIENIQPVTKTSSSKESVKLTIKF